MKKILLFVLLASSLYSQTQTAAQSAVQPALPANAPTRESVLKMLEVMKAKSNMQLLFKGMSDSFKDGFRQQFVKDKPDATPEQLKIIDGIFDEAFSSLNIDDLLGLMVDVYQRHLTQIDVDGVVAFYQSPVGQKYLAEQPAMIQESMKVSQDYAAKQMEAATTKMQQRLKEFTESLQKQEDDKSKPAVKPPAKKQ